MTLNKKYDEVMEHIEVTPEMRSRILGNIDAMDFAGKKQAKLVHSPNKKRFAALAAYLAVMLAGVWALLELQNTPDDRSVLGNNYIVELSSAEELSETVGFEVVELGNLPFKPESVAYTAYWGGDGRNSLHKW